MQTLEKFLTSRDVSLRCRELDAGDARSALSAEEWAAKHYYCELRRPHGDRPVTAIIGSDDGPPDRAEVLDMLAAEAAVVEEAEDYQAWAGQMGYELDSRRGERRVRRAKVMRRLLGRDGYRRLLWETERL